MTFDTEDRNQEKLLRVPGCRVKNRFEARDKRFEGKTKRQGKREVRP